MIVNITKKKYLSESPNEKVFFENFQKFIEKYNEVHTMNRIETQGWVRKSFKHPLQSMSDDTNCGVYVLKFMRDLINNNKIQNGNFDTWLTKSCNVPKIWRKYV